MKNIRTLASLAGHSTADLVSFIKLEAASAASAATNCAKGIITLVDQLGSEAEARATMKKAKLADCTVKNAMQLVWVYDDVVRKGFASETWFDAVLYHHAVQIRRAVAKVGVDKLHENGLFEASAKKNLIEFELIGDTGLTKAERIAKAEADAEEAAEQERLNQENVDGLPPAAEPAPVPSNVIPMTPPPPPPAIVEESAAKPAESPAPAPARTPVPRNQKTPLQEFDELANTLERFALGLVGQRDSEVVEAVRLRLAGLATKVNAEIVRAEAATLRTERSA